jgi:hypothetical protein
MLLLPGHGRGREIESVLGNSIHLRPVGRRVKVEADVQEDRERSKQRGKAERRDEERDAGQREKQRRETARGREGA